MVRGLRCRWAQDTARLTFGVLRGLPHNRFNAELYEASKIGKAKIQDWPIEFGIRAEAPTQDFLLMFVGNGVSKQANQPEGLAYSSAMVSQSPDS